MLRINRQAMALEDRQVVKAPPEPALIMVETQGKGSPILRTGVVSWTVSMDHPRSRFGRNDDEDRKRQTVALIESSQSLRAGLAANYS